VAADHETVLAYGALSPYLAKPAFARTVEDSVYVERSHRGTGLGGLILAELIRRARELEHHSILARITRGTPRRSGCTRGTASRWSAPSASRRTSSAAGTTSRSCSAVSVAVNGSPVDPVDARGGFDMHAQLDHVMKIAERPAPVMVKGAGSWLWDRDGKRYLDFVQGWAVNCLGHSPRVVLDALAAQGSAAHQLQPGVLQRADGKAGRSPRRGVRSRPGVPLQQRC
jgi:hypothetical protein